MSKTRSVIGIDAREAAGRPAGKGRYVLELLRYLPPTLPDVTLKLFTRQKFELPDHLNTEWVEIDSPGPLWHRAAAKRANQECDHYLSTTSYITPQFLKIPYTLTVYDLVAFKDLAMPQKRSRLIEQRTLRRAASRATNILTISQATADDLAKKYPSLAKRITVTPLAADRRFKATYPVKELTAVRKKYQLPRRFILTTGTLEPRKNQARLIRAYGRLPEKLRAETPLVLVGQPGWQYEAVIAAAREVGEPFVKRLDFVPDEDLAKLYTASTIFSYPSLYEGFGLPVLEAMQSGSPVITSDRSSLPEVGGKAVRYVNPEHTGEITAAMQTLLSNDALRARLRRAGLRQAKRFSWEATATKTGAVLTG